MFVNEARKPNSVLVRKQASLKNVLEIIAVVRDAKLIITFNSSTTIGLPFIAMKIRQQGKTLKEGLN